MVEWYFQTSKTQIIKTIILNNKKKLKIKKKNIMSEKLYLHCHSLFFFLTNIRCAIFLVHVFVHR